MDWLQKALLGILALCVFAIGDAAYRDHRFEKRCAAIGGFAVDAGTCIRPGAIIPLER